MRMRRYRIRWSRRVGMWIVCPDRGDGKFHKPFMSGTNLARLCDKLTARIDRYANRPPSIVRYRNGGTQHGPTWR